jgi:hypothetical protein
LHGYTCNIASSREEEEEEEEDYCIGILVIPPIEHLKTVRNQHFERVGTRKHLERVSIYTYVSAYAYIS